MQCTRKKSGERGWKTRAVAMLMSMVMAFGLFPAQVFAYEKEHWAAPYMEKMEDWGVMRESQLQDPDKPITRAEFMAMVNRAYGYTEKGEIPFEDVLPEDWFYEDVCIAYKANYIHGTSETTASPHETLTRETAAFILGKNMMLKEVDGENVDFVDGRDVSSWSRGIVKAAVQNYLISGYDDGSFRPHQEVTLGEVAVMLSGCIGTPVRESGDVSLGGVYGNVTITDSGVTLRDTTISGDLYITGGVGEGAVKLENVTVLGRIIDSGIGESESGQASVVMRNVIADELLVDNLRNEYVTLRTEGITQIGQVNIRTDTYLEDNTPQEYGLKQINVDGEEGIMVDFAGRIKNVTVESPKALVTAAKGTIQLVTVDEKSVGTQVKVERNAEIKELNLDVGTNVVGKGDVGSLKVNAPGSTTEMLPDQIVVRPGLTGNIAGEVMDTVAAEESSRDPKILSGYPLASDVAPTGLSAVFATNKRGTVYWAVSTIADGSVEAEELINHPSYGSIAEKYGNVKVSGADVKVQAKVTGLTVGGAYYLSAVLVDDRGQKSPVKVTAFTTPDNTKPDFASGFPYMSRVTDCDAQVTVMTTKSCKMYYALLPKGSTAPTVNELKSYSVSGVLGFGVRDMTKNTEDSFIVNDQLLEEEVSYDLYLWLTDADGANSSAVKKVSFTTVDKTPPRFIMEPTVNKAQATSVGLVYTLNEAGTVYWVVVDEGASYPKPKPGQSEIAPTDDYAKLQVASGLNSIKSGKVSSTANKEGTINITGLTAEKAYDLWYIAQDKAGNYAVEVKKLTIHTLDDSAPVVTQYFTRPSGTDKTKNPLPNTDIVLEFNENIRSEIDGNVFQDLYNNIKTAEDKENAKEKLGAALEGVITMYQNEGTTIPTVLPGRTNSTVGDNWVIDYRNAVVNSENGKVQIIFPTNEEDLSQSALNLDSGATYYFKLRDITDTSNSQNPISPNPVDYTNAEEGGHTLGQFTTVFAQVYLGNPSIPTAQLPKQHDDAASVVRVDMNFRMTPLSTGKVGDNYSYDVLMWSDTIVEYDLYYRVVDKQGNPKDENGVFYTKDSLPKQDGMPDSNGWIYLGNSGAVNPDANNMAAKSLNKDFNHCGSSEFPLLNSLKEELNYEFIISISKLVDSSNYDSWSGEVRFGINVASGASERLETLSKNLGTTEEWEKFVEGGLANQGGANGGVSVGTTPTGGDTQYLRQVFTNNTPPEFANASPSFVAGDTFVNMTLNLDRKGEIYYVIAPAYGTNGNPVVATTTPDVDTDDDTQDEVIQWDEVQDSGIGRVEDMPVLVLPDAQNIFKPPYRNELVKTGHITYQGGDTDQEEVVKDLQPQTKYYAYFVLKGSTSQKLSRVYIYKFETNEVSRPRIDLERQTGVVRVKTDTNAMLEYIIFTNNDLKGIGEMGQFLSANSEYTLPTAYEKYTVAQAMMETYYQSSAVDGNLKTGENGTDKADFIDSEASVYNGYSVFDVYAKPSLKSAVATIIRSGASGVPSTASGDLKTQANEFYLVDETKWMTELTPHYFLAVAYHESSQEMIGDTFKLVNNVMIPDKKPPTPEQISTEVDPSTSNLQNGTYSGVVSIQFDKTLYRSEAVADGDAKKVLAKKDSAPEDKDWVAIMDYLGGTAVDTGKVEISREDGKASSSFTLKFSNLSVGSSITFFRSGYISNSSGYTAQDKLILTLKKIPIKGEVDMGLKEYELAFVGTWQGKEIEYTGYVLRERTQGSN